MAVKKGKINRIEVGFKKGVRDALGERVRRRIVEHLRINVDEVRTIDVYTVEGNLLRGEIKQVAEGPLTDPVIQGYAINRGLARDFDWLIEVGFRPGVTDNVGRTATEAIRTLPTQSKLVLMSIILNEEKGEGRLTTGDVYETYRELSHMVGVTVLTQRRITDLISELDMLGIIHARVKSFGRGGRTKEIESSVPRVETMKILEEDEILQSIKNYRPKNQTTLI